MGDAFNPDSPYIEPGPGAHPTWLPPWDDRLIFETDLPAALTAARKTCPLTRLPDRWRTAWEHKRGKLR